MNKQLWILAGGNGAGKSTFYNTFLKPHGLSFVNADILAKELGDKPSPELSKIAQEQAWASCKQKLLLGETFCFETVFSHSSKVELILHAKSIGYTVNLVFIHLTTTHLNIARVIQRVSSGGHNVPYQKIKSRIPRTIENVRRIIAIVDQARLLDNSSGENPFKSIATVKNGKVVTKTHPLPLWAKEILRDL